MPCSIALMCKEGIVFGANPITRSGSSLRATNVDRFTQIGKNLILTGSGDFSDFQKITEILDGQWYKESVYGDETEADVVKYAHYLANLCYAKRNKIDPFLVNGALGGFDAEGKPRLYYVDQFGMLFEKDYITTGFGNYMLPALIGINESCL